MAGRRRPPGVLAAAVLLVACAAATMGTPAAKSAQSANATATISVVFKSVTLSTTALRYGHCSGGYSTGGKLGFPNGSCVTGDVRVTNGPASSTILVTGSDATPSDGGRPWVLCGGSGSPACATSAPGPDQYAEAYFERQLLGLSPVCDGHFGGDEGGCGQAARLEARTETLRMLGPTSSTDHSPTFTTEITWTAT